MNDGFHSNLQVQSMVFHGLKNYGTFAASLDRMEAAKVPRFWGVVGAVVKLRLDVAARVLISPGVGSTVLVQVADIPIVV